MHRVISIFVSVLVSLSICAAYAADDTPGGSRLKVGDTLEYFGLKPLIAEEKSAAFVNVADIVGPGAKQPVKLLLISFFASWCESCKHELPQIDSYYRLYGDKGLSALYICIDTDKDGAEKSRQFIQTNKLGATVLHDSYNIVARRYFKDAFVLPSSYLVGSDGRVLAVFSGGGDENIKALGYELDRFLNKVRIDSLPAKTDKSAE